MKCQPDIAPDLDIHTLQCIGHKPQRFSFTIMSPSGRLSGVPAINNLIKFSPHCEWASQAEVKLPFPRNIQTEPGGILGNSNHIIKRQIKIRDCRNPRALFSVQPVKCQTQQSSVICPDCIDSRQILPGKRHTGKLSGQ